MQSIEIWLRRWPSFKPEEIYSPESFANYPHILEPTTLDKLQILRGFLNKQIIVNHGDNKLRGIRTISENLAIKGAKESMHTKGRAFDVSIPGMSSAEAAEAIKKTGLFTMHIIYPTWVHIDTRFELSDIETIGF